MILKIPNKKDFSIKMYVLIGKIIDLSDHYMFIDWLN